MTLQHNYRYYQLRARFIAYSPTMQLPIYAIYNRYEFMKNVITVDPISTLKELKGV